jgi:hypothetical protein
MVKHKFKVGDRVWVIGPTWDFVVGELAKVESLSGLYGYYYITDLEGRTSPVPYDERYLELAKNALQRLKERYRK